jgi:hypothetical protein
MQILPVIVIIAVKDVVRVGCGAEVDGSTVK